MDYGEIVEVYDAISRTTKRLEITAILVEFLKKCPPEIIDKIVYLTMGRLYPEFVPLELGVADKLIMKAIAHATAAPPSRISALYRETGDLGKAVYELLPDGRRQVFLDYFSGTGRKADRITVDYVYATLEKIARAQGPGSQETKIRLLSDLLREAAPREALYIVKTVSGTLRLGVADMTILDALAAAFGGSKDARTAIERAYNVSSDLGAIAKALATGGLGAIAGFRPSPGRPIKPMLAERLPSPEEILEKMGGRCAAEYKYDGERVQIHRLADGSIRLFSRSLEEISSHFPDIVRLASEGIAAEQYVVEGEIVAVNPDSGDLLPFQELMHRRRKHGVEEMMSRYPVSLRLFDAMFIGEDLTGKPYPERRESLRGVVKENHHLRLVEQRVVDNTKELEAFFEDAISNGCEGIIAKSLGKSSVYKAGARGWLWIKYKREYKSEMHDTVDLVAVGAFMGLGRRAGNIGTLLLAAYDEGEDVFRTACKCSTGFTDEDLRNMNKIFEKDIIHHRHARVDSKIVPDIWLVPSKVLEILGAEITLSPIHTCGFGAIREEAGLAVRFPRFTGNWRTDKKPEDATTVEEFIEIYRKQLRRV